MESYLNDLKMAKTETKLYDLSKQDVFTFMGQNSFHKSEMKSNGSLYNFKAKLQDEPSKQRRLKVFRKRTPEEENKNVRAFFNEVQSTARLNHPNVVKGVKSAICEDHFAICTNFYPKCLSQMIPTLNKIAMEFYLSQIACAVDYIHCQSVAHLDLNPNHVLIDEHGNAVISDFGSSRILLKRGNIAVQSGVEGFRAPEVSMWNFKGINPFKADIYSVGAILWNMVFGVPSGELACRFSLTIDDLLPMEEDAVFRLVLSGTMDRKPETRWTCGKLVDELEQNLPSMAKMIRKLTDHDNLPPVTNWIQTENFLM